MEIYPYIKIIKMKKSILTFGLSIVMVGAIVTSCQSSVKKEDKTSDKTQNTESDSVKVQQDTTSMYQKFINESEVRINTNEKSLAEIKAKIATEKKDQKAGYEKKLAQLEQKNQALKTKIIDNKDKQVSNWDNTQLEFRKDLEELGTAIADFFVKEE
jgi:hypothetical protein